ncbi:ATP-binding protein [Phenylobacterium sp.]|uniref:ATP-binding protein n=1 Tax=Phenylobacterium sp. TaxID=1871053 RepID=UPI00391B625D
MTAEMTAGEPTAAPTGEAFTAYQLTLGGLVFPVFGHIVFNSLSAICLWLLGHPGAGLVLLVSATAIDALQQHLLRRWLLVSGEAEPQAGFRRLAALVAARVTVYMVPVVAVAIQGGLGEMAYFTTLACMIMAIALSAGALSRLVFWGFAGPLLAAFTLIVAWALPPREAIAMLFAGGVLVMLLVMISANMTRATGAWHGAFNRNLALVRDLEAARDQALAERSAADQAREEARRATRAKSDFLATMSHEIRTPMNGVLGMAQLLRREETDPAQIARVDTLIDSGEYLLSILNDILDVAKIDAGRLEILPRHEDLRLLMDRLIGFWGGRADQKGLDLNLTIAPDAPDFVLVDALRLRQILFNLVGNALKFTERGAVDVIVSVRPDGPGRVIATFSVRDTGPGIPPEQLPYLFDRFSQGDEVEARKFGGTGLGLAIVRQLAGLMGGRAWAESRLGQGSAFHVEIPLQVAGAATAPAEPGPDPDASGLLEGLAILAVDDNAVNLMVLDQLLAGFGARVVKAASGPEALEQLAAQPFDLVLMDIQMPGMTGAEALVRLRGSAGPNRAAPVIALTADVMSGGRDLYLDQGFTDHTPKPIQVADLMAAIVRALSAAPEDADAARSA